MMTNYQILNSQLECRLQHREHYKLNGKKKKDKYQLIDKQSTELVITTFSLISNLTQSPVSNRGRSEATANHHHRQGNLGPSPRPAYSEIEAHYFLGLGFSATDTTPFHHPNSTNQNPTQSPNLLSGSTGSIGA